MEPFRGFPITGLSHIHDMTDGNNHEHQREAAETEVLQGAFIDMTK